MKNVFQHPYQHKSCCFNMVYAFFLIFYYPSNRNTWNGFFQIAVINYTIVQLYQQFNGKSEQFKNNWNNERIRNKINGWGAGKYIKWSQNKITLASTLLLTLQISASVDTFWKQEKYLEIQKPSFNTIYSRWFKNSTPALFLPEKTTIKQKICLI